MNADRTDYELLYNPRLVVKDYQAIFDRWEKDSERARARLEGYPESGLFKSVLKMVGL